MEKIKELCNLKFITKKIIKMKAKYLLMVSACSVLCGCFEHPKDQALIRSVCVTQPIVEGEVLEKSFSGIVKEAHEVSLGFRIGGQLKQLFVKEGDFVKKGKLVATLDDADYRLDVEALQVQYNQMKDEVARTQKLYEGKSISANDYEKAVAGLQQLEVQLQTMRNKLSYTKLYAPTDCYIQNVNYSEAEMLNAGSPVFELLDVSHMEVEVDIPAAIYMVRDNFIEFGGHTSYTNEEMPLHLLSITPKADGNQLYRMKLILDNKNKSHLTAGMNMDVRIRIKSYPKGNVITVPLHALLREGENTYVWVLKADSTLQKRSVTLGNMDADGNVIISNGLKGDELVVRAGVQKLREGEKIKVLEESEKTNVGGLL